MATTPMRIRLDPETDRALRDAARGRGMPVATLAVQLVRSGLANRETSPDSAAHPLVAATESLLDWEPDDERDRAAMEAAEQYARMAALGSVPAVREWLVLVHRLLTRVQWASEDD
jgi:hypothetical protein